MDTFSYATINTFSSARKVCLENCVETFSQGEIFSQSERELTVLENLCSKNFLQIVVEDDRLCLKDVSVRC